MTSRNRKSLTLFDDFHSMMSDEIRLAAYVSAIEATVEPGDVVLDLGAGLGILSLIAARAGARKVYAVEKGDAAQLARRIIAANGLENIIEVLEEHSLDVQLAEPADVLVSETLGSFGLEENTLGFTIDARDRLLRPGARMVPARIQPWLAPVDLPDERDKAAFWSDVAGFDFTAASDELLSRMSLADVPPSALLAKPQPLAPLDLREVASAEVKSRHLFQMERAGTVHGLAGWFLAELSEGVHIHTAPGRPATHWRQAFFPYRDPVDVVVGDIMEVTLEIAPRSERSDESQVHYDFRCTQLTRES